MAKTDAKKSGDGVYYNENAKKGNPWWFQIMVNGKRVTRRGFRTRTEAKKERDALSADLNRGQYIDPTKVTYGEYFADWLAGRDNIEASTREMYQSYFNKHISKHLGSIQLSKLSALDIKKFITHLRTKGINDEPGFEKGLGDESVKRIYSVVDASLNSAESFELITRNPTAKIPKGEKPKVEKKERQIWDNDSVKLVLASSKGTTRFWIAYFLAIMTGMRQGEILGLQWADVDFEKATIRVRRSLRKNKTEFKSVKNASSVRVISISPLTVGFLKEHRDIIEMEKKKLGRLYQDNDLVVCSSKGTPAYASKVLEKWYDICDKYKPAHEPRITYHDLRHQSASIMLNEREDIRVVSKRLGHSTVAQTLNTYSHLLPTGQETAVLSLDRAVGIDIE
ncbi:site-specific integrase [Paenibacillus sp. N4]|uniref:tyrosine-type recombinase/integrase n=1 Tax=Paenibacillus vietnamensis TaxID=2590547 RepID=UPI001CD12528|nr:site-specific integrase [Paenibacillus vietnamensis]MCA0754932.1 site-specific integrase [Paenibacillus vietnamensis]